MTRGAGAAAEPCLNATGSGLRTGPLSGMGSHHVLGRDKNRMSSCSEGARAARRRARAIIVAAGAMAVTAALAAPAGAAVGGSHVVAVLPDSQGLELSGYPLNDKLN